MAITTTTPTEAQLESRINATLSRVFIGTVDLRHQLRFKVRVGHTVFDAGSADYVEGRADILVYQHETPLAVLELKREGLAIKPADEEQGRSYALLAQAPLVVITNGTETRIFQTHDMARLEGTTVEADELTRRVEAASTAARTGVSTAISKLLGTDLATSAVKALTTRELAELTSGWESGERFVEGFIVPRRATRELREVLRSGRKVAVLAGPPLSGKSSVLRELALTSEEVGWDVLYVEGSSCGEGLFRRLANVLAAQFSWPAGPDDVRVWVRQLANRVGRLLVICIDTLPLASAILLGELDELLGSFGDGLRVVVAVDENDLDSLVHKPNRREKTRIGRISSTIKVGNYDDDEFKAAVRVLAVLGGGLVYGALYAPELRAPWVLRAAVADQMVEASPERQAVLAPLLGVQVFGVADDRFSDLGELRDDLKRLTVAYLNDLNTKRHHGDVLSSLQLFSIRQEVVREHLDRTAVHGLVRAGILCRGASFSDEATWVIRVPELFGHLIANRIASTLPRKVSKDSQDAANWLIAIGSKILFGDAICAQAIFRAMPELGGGLYIDLINSLLRLPPRREKLPTGSRMVALLPRVGLVDMNVGQDGMLSLGIRGSAAKTLTVPIEDDGFTTVANMDGWLILSQLREFRVVFQDEGGSLLNLAGPLLLELGSCTEVLRRPGSDLEGFHTHAIEGGSISCFQNGIAEPITWSIAELLSNDIPGVDRDAWVREAATSGSAALVNRLGQALTHLSELEEIGSWAKEMLANEFQPALAALPQFH